MPLGTISSGYLNLAFHTIYKFSRLTPPDTICSGDLNIRHEYSGLLDLRAELDPGVGYDVSDRKI